MSNKYIVITSINGLTKGIRKFASIHDWEIIIIGDTKSPHLEKYPLTNVTFLSIEEQKKMGLNLSNILPSNHYSRKNLGYLYAIREGAECIGDTDDDNIPYENWGEGIVERMSNMSIITYPRIVNIYRLFTQDSVWPRGFPLSWILDESEFDITVGNKDKVSIWQGLVDNEPDVDAIFRLVKNTKIKFHSNGPFALGNGTYCPFNSQNTIWFPTAFIYLYLPIFVTFRFTDILRSYIAQRGIQQLNSMLAFTKASVYQERNEHNIMTDFVDELPCYLHIERIIEIIENTQLSGNPYEDILTLYTSLNLAGITDAKEIKGLEMWVEDLNKIL